MKIRLFLIVTLLVAVGMSFPVRVGAVSPTGSPRPTRPVTTPQAQACDVIKTRVGVMIQAYKDREAVKVAKYDKSIALTTALLDKLTTEGKDTTQAKADLLLMKTKVAKFETDFAAFVTKATEVQNLPCTNVSMYLVELQKARSLLRVVHADVSDIQKFYNSVLRTDLLGLRDGGEEGTGTLTISPRPSITQRVPSVTHSFPSGTPRVTHFPPGPADTNDQ